MKTLLALLFSLLLWTTVRADDPSPKDYAGPLRPQFHFSPEGGWMNDPNGLAYFNGEYHFLYQYNPAGWQSGVAYWGHAVSKDLLHWTQLPPALSPDDAGQNFSGGAALDKGNTSGFGARDQPPLVCIYTATKAWDQRIAFTTDGRNFTKFQDNPVLKMITDHNRDPNIFWYEPTRTWVMALYVGIDDTPTGPSPDIEKRTIQFFNSPENIEFAPKKTHVYTFDMVLISP